MEARFVRLLRSVHASALTAIVAGAGTELLARLAAVALLWVGAGLVLGGNLTPGELMSCYALLAYLTAPLGRLVAMNRTAQDALIAAERLFEIMDLEREDERPSLDPDPASLLGDLRFEQLSARYGGRPRVLHDVTFSVPRGRVTAVVGESGSGKSTLAALAQRIYPADGGRVRLGEHDVAHLGLPALRRAVGVVPQRADLFTGTLLENIALGEPTPDPRRVGSVCQLLGLTELVASLPHGLQTQLGEQGASLSGGQRQRVAIARALYRHPAVLILDEATAALDSIAERQVQHAVRAIAREGCAVLVIAHRLSTIVDADTIVVLDAGRVVEQGTHAELVGRGGAYSRLWAHQYPAAA
jgi:ATP-binding cassette subfamily B protein